jgi:hypothetical protein
MTATPLTVLDLVPISSGSNATQALRNSIDLARQTERFGYARRRRQAGPAREPG